MVRRRVTAARIMSSVCKRLPRSGINLRAAAAGLPGTLSAWPGWMMAPDLRPLALAKDAAEVPDLRAIFSKLSPEATTYFPEEATGAFAAPAAAALGAAGFALSLFNSCCCELTFSRNNSTSVFAQAAGATKTVDNVKSSRVDLMTPVFFQKIRLTARENKLFLTIFENWRPKCDVAAVCDCRSLGGKPEKS